MHLSSTRLIRRLPKGHGHRGPKTNDCNAAHAALGGIFCAPLLMISIHSLVPVHYCYGPFFTHSLGFDGCYRRCDCCLMPKAGLPGGAHWHASLAGHPCRCIDCGLWTKYFAPFIPISGSRVIGGRHVREATLPCRSLASRLYYLSQLFDSAPSAI